MTEVAWGLNKEPTFFFAGTLKNVTTLFPSRDSTLFNLHLHAT